jgi:hypothetical protein
MKLKDVPVGTTYGTTFDMEISAKISTPWLIMVLKTSTYFYIINTYTYSFIRLDTGYGMEEWNCYT